MTGENAIFDLYDRQLVDAAATLQPTRRLTNPTAHAHAVSRLCGSTLSLDLNINKDEVLDFGLEVRACILGQAAAALTIQNIIGATRHELLNLATTMQAMIRKRGPPPIGKWHTLEALAPVQDKPSRHASTLLIFDAIQAALTP